MRRTLAWTRLPYALCGVTASLFAVVAVQSWTGFGGAGLSSFFTNWLYDAVGLAAGLTCLARAATAKERLVSVLVAAGILFWTAGDVYWTLRLQDVANPPYPSFADLGYLGFYVPTFAGLGLLVRRQVIHFDASVWLDGFIAACAVSAVASGVVLADVWRTASGDFAAVATNMAYPVGDALLLSLVLAAFAFSGWRLDRVWLLLGGGLAVFAVADSIYLVQVANGTYKLGTTLDLGWPAGFVLIAGAACAPGRAVVRGVRLEGRRVIVAPLVLAAVCLSVEVYDHFQRVGALAVATASLGLAAVVARLAVTFNEHLGLLRMTRTESLTDPLTGLSNRRALLLRLEQVYAGPSVAHLLLLFDLNGFKQYNDTFGHGAGDMLLSRLGARLKRSLRDRGEAFRLGGDEFCILLEGELIDLDWVRAAATASLREGGDGFAISCSSGHVLISTEASTPSEALQVADRRMYAEKGIRVAGRNSSGVLVQALIERDRYLGEHLLGVVDCAVIFASEAGLRGADVDLVRAAAELHNVGKLALPESILMKPGPLDEDEWRLIRQHTLIGERIVAAADGLDDVAAIVRSSHERWDGAGYPDGLAGEEIPFAARLIAICDAYDAMITSRPYVKALSTDQAREELLRNAGTQFDPELAQLFVAAVLDKVTVPAPTQLADRRSAAG